NYSHEAVVHEALTLMAYLAAITSRITLATGILILPQRQTALVAKQAAQIDVLSGGGPRLRIGVGGDPGEDEAPPPSLQNRGGRRSGAGGGAPCGLSWWPSSAASSPVPATPGSTPCRSSGRFQFGSGSAAAITPCRPSPRCGASAASPTAGAPT